MEAVADDSSLENLLASIDVSPDTFLQPSTSLQAASLVAAKRILDPVISDYSVFREVTLKGLDVDQIWEQIQMVGDQVKKVAEKQGDIQSKTNGVKLNGRDVHESEEDTSPENESSEEMEDEREYEVNGNDEVGSEKESEEEVGGEEDDDDDVQMLEWEGEELSDEKDESDEDEFPTNPEMDEVDEDEDDEEPATNKTASFKKDVHGLNDEFFSIDDFNRLTEQQEVEPSDDEDNDEIDYFADPDEQDSDDEDENPDEIQYKDFYLPPPNSTSASRKRKRAHFEDEDGGSAEDELNDEARVTRFHKDLFADAIEPNDEEQQNVSVYAKRKAAIQAEVERLEQENIAGKQWMYIGEASAKSRPKNSLLEVAEEIDIERSAKPVPIITEERTRTLEEVIKQRIIDNQFDDVKRKLPPEISQKSRALDDDPDMQEPGSKPTRGLAEIYEQEHLRRIDPVNNPTPLSVSVQKQHAEIDELWKTLSHQLDSLTSWRFIPAPEVADQKVVANIPAVDMEDARPEAEAGATMLAPQEVYRPEAKKGEVVVGGLPVARVEMSREEKARARKREGRRTERKKLPLVEGGKQDVVQTLRKGGVKIITHGQPKGKARGGARVEGQ